MKNMIIMFENNQNYYGFNIGGKARSLLSLNNNGFSVPDGFIITPVFQQKFFKHNKITEFIDENKNKLLSDDYTLCLSTAKQIRDKIVCSNFKKEEVELIENALKAIENKYDSFAVRSSCGVEDGEEESWAGQFDTFLSVNPNDILEYIKRCWASIYGMRAISYNTSTILGDTIPQFSVVIQGMVNGDFSGIAFSVDPYDYNESHIRIEGVPGTGDKVVGGQVTPYSVVLSKDDGVILKRTFGSFGRVELIKPSLLIELMEQVKRIEVLFAFPVDVEWTISNSEISILQARPVTTVNRLKSEKQSKLLPDILDYQLTFKVYGLGFMFADLLCYGFGYLHPLFICSDGIFLQYFTNERMEYAAKYGHRWLSTPGGFEQYRSKFTDFHEKNYSQLQRIVNNDLVVEEIKTFFDLVYQYFIFYSKMDFQFTNLTFLYANENPIIADSLQKISSFKDVARVWVNNVSINDDCLLNILLSRISKRFNINIEDLNLYKISEIIDLFHGKTVKQDDLISRNKGSLVLTDGKTINYIYGEKAVEFISRVNEIEYLQSMTDVVGQVANKNSEKYVEGIARIINVNYSNLDQMENEIAQMQEGEILISEFTAPELMSACSKAKAIVTDLGGMLSHAAIVSRELGIPCVVGTEHASRSFNDGDSIRIDLELGTVNKL